MSVVQPAHTRRSRAWRSTFASALALGGLMLAEPRALADVAAAKRSYSEGMTLAREGHLTEALERFRQAYVESPHYAVLYNMARVALDLGQTREAAGYFNQFLEEGGTRIPAARRAEVERELAALSRAAPSEPREPPVPAATTSIAPTSVDAPAPSEPESAPPEQLTREPKRPALESAHLNEHRRQSSACPPPAPPKSARSRSAAFAFGGVGLAVLSGSIAIKIWNHVRYNDWRDQHRALAQTAVSVETSTDLKLKLDYEYRRGLDVAERASIRRFDDLSWVGVAVGAGLVAGALVLQISLGQGATVRAGTNQLSLTSNF